MQRWSPGSPRDLPEASPHLGFFPLSVSIREAGGNRKPEFGEAEQGTPSLQGLHVQSGTPQLDLPPTKLTTKS